LRLEVGIVGLDNSIIMQDAFFFEDGGRVLVASCEGFFGECEGEGA
jgi:hypothetical protein